MFSYIFRTLILSLSIFWRMVLVMPFYITFAVCAAFGVLFVPISGLMIAGALGASAFAIILATALVAIAFTMINIIANIVAIRAGLSARDAWGLPDFIRLIKVGFQYSVFHTFVTLFILSFAAGALIVLHLTGTLDGMAEVSKISPNDPASLAALHPAVLAITGVAVVLMYIVLAAMQTPLAAASHGVTIKAHQPDFFYGFGDRFFIQFVIVVVTNILLTVLQIYTMLASIPLLLLSLLNGDGVAMAMFQALGVERAATVGGILLFGIWLFSLLNAAATQSYLDLVARREREAAVVVVAQRADPNDLRDLRASRMK